MDDLCQVFMKQILNGFILSNMNNCSLSIIFKIGLKTSPWIVENLVLYPLQRPND